MARGLLLSITLLVLGCISVNECCARPEPQPLTSRVLTAFSHSRQLTQDCYDLHEDCPTWAQQGLCGNEWTYLGDLVGVDVCPLSCYNCTDPQTSAENHDWLGMINTQRAAFNISALVGDKSLVYSAQKYANQLSQTCDLTPSGIVGVGETLAAGFPCWASVVQDWVREFVYYSYSNPGYAPGAGNFTQLVWASTTNVGCGVASTKIACPYGAFYVCHYSPPGNIDGEFADNVLPPVSAFG